MGVPFAHGSICYKPYVGQGDAASRIAELLEQAARAESAGFDGVTLSEHHLGFPGYLPNPLQAAGWILDTCPTVWAAPAPMLPLLRPVDLIAEEIAWLAARHPSRVGAGFAAGAIARDFELAGTDQRDLAVRFEAALHRLTAVLSGTDLGWFTDDPAVSNLVQSPVPVISAASSFTACRRAARVGCGILLESAVATAEVKRMVDVYRASGGRQSAVLVRRVWVGESPPVELERARDELVRAAVPVYQRHAWLDPEQMIISGGPGRVAASLVQAMRETSTSSLNLRVHVPGLAHSDVLDQIDRLADVLSVVRAAIAES